MPDPEARLKAMLFEYGTTYKSDYQTNQITAPVRTTYKKNYDNKKNPRHPPLRDVHTLSDWKGAPIRFDLLLKRKDIIGTYPTTLQKRYEKPIDADSGREEAQLTRPRLVMTPAVSLDDVTDERARSILCEDMYTSAITRGLREAASSYFSVKAPLPGLPTNSNPIALPKLRPPVVSPEWRMETVTWDGAQLRAYCDSTKEFWLRHEQKCRACDETKAVDAHRKMQRQMKASRR